MYTVGVAFNGEEAVDLIISKEPDVVLLDLVMPVRDGLGVLEKIQTLKLNKKPSFIVLSAVGQDQFIRRALVLGISYYLIKPVDIDILLKRIRQIYEEKDIEIYGNINKPFSIKTTKSKKSQIDSYFSSENDEFKDIISIDQLHKEPEYDEKSTKTQEEKHEHLTMIVDNIIEELGVPKHLSGFRYLRQAIYEASIHPEYVNTLTKNLYPKIAEQLNTTPGKVERGIRVAIHNTWSKMDYRVFYNYFGYMRTKINIKPSNSEFIATISERTRLRL